MADPVLCVDVGNSRTKFGVFPSATGRTADALPECASDLAVPHGEPVVWGSLRERFSLDGGTIVRGFISGSHPDGIAGLIDGWPTDWPPPTVVNEVSRIPPAIRPQAPKNAGMDRILKAVACNVIRPPHRPALVIDTGTATCVDAISGDGAFEGGAILPGFELLRGLFISTRRCFLTSRSTSWWKNPTSRSAVERGRPCVAGCCGDRSVRSKSLPSG